MLEQHARSPSAHRDIQSSIDLYEEPDFTCLKPHTGAQILESAKNYNIHIESLLQRELRLIHERTRPFEHSSRVHHKPSTPPIHTLIVSIDLDRLDYIAIRPQNPSAQPQYLIFAPPLHTANYITQLPHHKIL